MNEARSFRRVVVVIVALIASVFAARPPVAHAAALTEVTSFGSNPGQLRMFRYVPDNIAANAPLLVVLHGCTQSAAGFDNEPGFTQIADTWKVALLLPQQQSSNNQSSCFNWFQSGDISRGQGEALSIKQMVDTMKSSFSIDASRVYVTGLSAGGAMTAVMLAAYPDVFSGGAVVAGIPYACATTLNDAFTCESPGVNKTPLQWGDLVRAADSGYSGPWPKVAIWQGDNDHTVSPSNMQELVDQWTNVNGVDQTADVTDTVKGYPHKVYKNGSGAPVVETYSITGMDHGIPVDPGANADQCGTAGAFILDVNVCAAYFIGRWLGLDNTDSQAPAVTLTAPSNGASVSGVVTISATATDNVGVSKVEFLVDGTVLSTDTASPYSATWDTAGAANGSHTILARGYDAAGNVGTSAQISVTVTGGVADTTPPTVGLTFPTNGATVNGTITLSATASDDFAVTKVEFFVDSASVGVGSQSGQAGPWTLAWNTTAVTPGSHTLQAKAYDAAGNIGTSSAATITVNQNVLALNETFSDRDASGDPFDTTGWTAGGYTSNTDNHTPAGPSASNSEFGYASSGIGCAGGAKTQTLSRSVTLGGNPKLSYWRKLDLHANVNTTTTASFKVKINTSTVVDQQVVTFANYTESVWTQRPNIDLSAFANQTVTIGFEVMGNSNVCLEVYGKAWLDDITIDNPQQASDTTPPAVNVSAPVNGATVSGAVDVTAAASDNVGVAKVEFYVDGTLAATDTASPYSFTWNTTSVPNASHRLMAKGYDAAGNSATDDDTAVTVSNGGGGATIVTLQNVDANDGYVKANSDGSGAAVGTLENSMGLAMGRGTDGMFSRTVLSFDTSSIPDTAVITRAYVTVTLNSSSGDPWANPAGNTLVVDVQNGCFNACTIEAADWAAAATQPAVAGIVKWTSGSTSSGDFASAGLGAISKTGTTQVKLRFSSNQTATNYIFVGHGTTASIHIEYH